MTVIEPALPPDADEIRVLVARTVTHSVTQDAALLADTIANVGSNIDLWLAEPQRCLHLVARVQGRIVGVVLVKDHWNLCSLFVAPESQGSGIGRALVEAASAACAGLQPPIRPPAERGPRRRGLLRAALGSCARDVDPGAAARLPGP